MRPLKLLIHGPVSAGKTTFVQTLAQAEAIETEEATSERIGKERTTVALDFGKLTLRGVPIHLFGMPGQERFDFMLDILVANAAGLLFLVPGDKPHGFPKARQLLTSVLRRYPMPFVIGVTRQDVAVTREPGAVADVFQVPRAQVIGLNATSPESAAQALMCLLERICGGTWRALP